MLETKIAVKSGAAALTHFRLVQGGLPFAEADDNVFTVKYDESQARQREEQVRRLIAHFQGNKERIASK